MSCHDGTVALGDVLHGGPFTFTGTNVVDGKLAGGSAYLKPSAFGDNHPVGVRRPDEKLGFTRFKSSPTGDAVDYDANGYVQCQSCHNPHLTSYAPFLKKDKAASAICLTCHDL